VLQHDRPWPVAPRPFADEPLGTWLGRVAARYCMAVAQLCDAHTLDIDFQGSGLGWILLPWQPVRILQRLATLARLTLRDLEAMQSGAEWPLARTHASYCPRCLFLNELDVTGPVWKRSWLAPGAAHCYRHDRSLGSIPAGKLRHCRNFDDVVHAVGRQEKRLRNAELAHATVFKTSTDRWMSPTF
jgi:hypothetical protein